MQLQSTAELLLSVVGVTRPSAADLRRFPAHARVYVPTTHVAQSSTSPCYTDRHYNFKKFYIY